MGPHFYFLCKEKDAKSPFVRIPICSRITSSRFSKLPILVFPVAAELRIAEFSTWRGNQSSVRNSHSPDTFSNPGKLVLLVWSCEENAVWFMYSVSKLFPDRGSTHTTLRWLLLLGRVPVANGFEYFRYGENNGVAAIATCSSLLRSEHVGGWYIRRLCSLCLTKPRLTCSVC